MLYLCREGDAVIPSEKCVELVKGSEGCRLTAYRDCADVLTIGYGHTGADVHEGQTWTQERADQALHIDLGAAGAHVTSLITVPLSQGQYDALTDFVYNLGQGRLANSTLLKLLNLGFYDRVEGEIMKWTYAGGAQQPGLIARRTAECALWRGDA